MGRWALKRRVLSVATGLVLATAGLATGHVGNYVFPIYELPTADLPSIDDGTLEDWEAVVPDASLDYTYFVNSSSSPPIDIGDLAWRVFIAWHYRSQRVFFAIERVDDQYMPPGSDLANSERTDFAVDGDHNGGRFAGFSEVNSEEEMKRLTEAEAQWYHLKSEPFGNVDKALQGGGAALPWVTEPPWGDVGGAVDVGEPHHEIVEAYVTPFDELDWRGPERSVRSALDPGKIIGFSVRVYDYDGDRDVGIYSLMENVPSHLLLSADGFVDGELIPCFEGDCSHGSTAVAPSSWGRIKAAVWR